MPSDTYKPKGPLKSDSPESGGADAKKYPIIGIVKDNIDPTRAGRIKVALQDGKGSLDPDSSDAWVTVQYLTTFFGSVRPSSGDDSEDYGSYKTNPSAYGQWQAPPDIGTKVVCVFVGGDPDAGFYIGCIPEPEILQMVPAIGASEAVTLNEGEAKSYGGATRLPVTNLNTNNEDKADSNEFLDTPRPVHSYTASVMSQQGIIRDPIRGPISSSASREPASRVGWGVSTPGRPIYEGGYDDQNLPENLDQSKAEQLKVISRRGGHSIVMDDGDIIGRDQLIRIRTALGHQILMSDDGQTLMLLHSNGQSYIELGKEGTVDVFAMNSINMRTLGDFNIHADRDINMHAMENFNIQAKNIHTNSEEETKSRAGTDYKISALNNFTAKAGAALAVEAGGQASVAAGAEAFVNGSKVNLNSGSSSLSPEEVPIITLIAQTDSLFDKEKGWAAAPANLLTIASRAPAHYPWANAGMGVDIKVSGNAEDNLPAPSSPEVQAVNQAAEEIPAEPPSVATISSVPPTTAVSESLDKATTDAVLSSIATSAAEGPAAEAVTSGASIVSPQGLPGISGITSALGSASATIGGVANQIAGTARVLSSITGSFRNITMALGSFAQTPRQLTQSGILKPGSDTLINGLASSGKTLMSTTPDNLFTGKAGAENITRLAGNSTAQAASLVSVMKVAQQQLNEVGILCGTESSAQSAGIVAAAATLGTDEVIDIVRQIGVNQRPSSTSAQLVDGIITTDPVSAAITSAQQLSSNTLNRPQNVSSAAGTNTNNVLRTIGSGIAAANLANSIGGLGGIANSLRSIADTIRTAQGVVVSLTSLIDSVKGISGSAYALVLAAFARLEPNIPQYLSEFARTSAALSTLVSRVSPSKKDGSPSNSGNFLSGLASNTMSLANDIQIARRLTNSIEVSANNTINGITGLTSTIAGSQTRPPNTINISTVDNILSTQPATGESLSTLIDSVSESPDQSLIDAVSDSTDVINSMSGAASAFDYGGLTSLSNAAKVTQSGAGASTASQLASGVTNIPGGMKTISTVVNLADNADNSLPGTTVLSREMSSTQTQVLNGLSTARQLTNTLGSVANQIGGLTSAIVAGLPIGQASQLLSSLSALGAGGASPIKLADIGFNTVNRSSLTEQINDVIGDPGIPKPNFVGEVSDATVSSLEQELIAALSEIRNIEAELDISLQEETRTYSLLIALERDLPLGDPAIAAARNEYLEATRRSNELMSRYIEARGAEETPLNNNTGLV
jgi:hypothetical protein